MTLKLITAPATEPLSLVEAKLQLKVEHTEDDALITTLLQAMREHAEHLTGRAFITQTWEQVLDAFPACELELGMPPVASIVSVKYIDPAGVEQTLPPTAYALDADLMPGWLLPAAGTTWPATLATANAVRVRFSCGYGAAADVPAGIKVWMKARIGTLYRFREDVQEARVLSSLPESQLDRLLDRFKVWT